MNRKTLVSILLALCLMASTLTPLAMAQETPPPETAQDASDVFDAPETELDMPDEPDALMDDLPMDESTDGDTVEVSDYDDLLLAMENAADGDVIGITGSIIIPANSTLGFAEKHLTMQRVDTGSHTGFEVEETDEASSITVTNITFDGADIKDRELDSYFISRGEIFFYDCIFISCHTSYSGGAVQVRNGDAFFRDCTFDNNSASIGAHISVNTGNLIQIKDSVLTNGYASFRGGAIRIPSGIMCSIVSCDIFNNEAAENGGALWNSGIISLTQTRIFNNAASNGGGDIYSESGSVNLDDEDGDFISLYDDIEVTPLGWFYDFPTGRIETPDSLSSLPLMLKFKVQGDVDPNEPDDPNTPDNPDNPETPDEPDDTDNNNPDDVDDTDDNDNNGNTPTPPNNGNSNTGGNYTPTTPKPAAPEETEEPEEEQTTTRVLSCNGAVLDPTRRDYLLGYADSQSGRNDPISRARAAQVLYRLLTPDSLENVYTDSFVDVSKDDWYYEIVNTLKAIGVVSGCGNDLFQPDKGLTVAEMITLLSRFTEPRTDQMTPLEHWSSGAVNTAASLTWIEYDDDFDPNREVTVQEFIVFIITVFDWTGTA